MMNKEQHRNIPLCHHEIPCFYSFSHFFGSFFKHVLNLKSIYPAIHYLYHLSLSRPWSLILLKLGQRQGKPRTQSQPFKITFIPKGILKSPINPINIFWSVAGSQTQRPTHAL